MLSNLDSNNLYVALGLERNASEGTVREHIGALYREALANAEHRDLQMRQYYERLLEVLPRGYNTLLDEGRRAQHNAYLDTEFEGSFEQYLEQQGQKADYALRECEGLLEVRGDPVAVKAPASVPSVPLPVPSLSSKPGTTAAGPTPLSLLVSGGVGLMVLVITRGVLHMPLTTGLGAAVLVGVLLLGIFFLFRSRS